MPDLSLTYHRDSTRINPAGEPVSSDTTSVENPVTAPPPDIGTGSSGSPTPLNVQLGTPVTPEETAPQIWIATALPSATNNAVIIQFDYLPESVSFGVSAIFTPTPIPFTSGRWLSYENSEIDEVNLTVKVVAGCNNCITYFGGKTAGSNYQVPSGLTAGKFVRNTLIVIARALYSLPLPGNNLGVNGNPVPTCRLKVGKMFSGVGAFSSCSIQFNGPYDFDGSPTDMDVSLRFTPSEFYDSTTMVSAKFNPGNGNTQTNFGPRGTPTGELLLSGKDPYALTFGETQTGLVEKLQQQTPTDATTDNPTTTYPTITNDTQIPESQLQGPNSPTPTNQEAAAAMGYPAASTNDSYTYYDKNKDSYTFGATHKPGDPVDVFTGGTSFPGNVVRAKVESDRAGVRPPIGP
jgi:hypothetical protein